MTELTSTERARRRQILTAIGIAAGIFGVASVGVLLSGGDEPAQPTKTDLRTRSYIAPGEQVAPADAWRGVSDSRLANLEGKLSALETEQRDAKRKLDPSGIAPPPTQRLTESDLDERLRAYERSVANQYPPGRPSDPVIALPQAPAEAQGTRQAATPIGTTQPTAPAAPAPVRTSIMTVRLRAAETPAPTAGVGISPATRSNSTPQSPERTTATYLPAGMFGQASLLSGLDAPTGGQAQSNPHPVLLRLNDLAVLPNRYRHNWTYCHLLGAGYGDLSSERAYIRTETLSCVGADGRVLDVPVKGFIVGEDGKAGMRGRLVSKQGQVLGNALLAGVVGGIGTGLERSASVQSVSPLGSTSSVKPGQALQAGIGTGVGRSLDRLADYYITLAEKMFPVIEIDADRVVDVILSEGVYADVQPDH
ncbi:conjugal transfer pilus assembly protein TraB [Pseudoduganella lurida]|uniref:Conjugal transfer pilus assembly protein TraB n=1 Tax=Pseudoduganella lurida TaxID=1036180 RepID=A0A562RJR9_9BURK|nr:TrbI/VirB10 family protein [Pseudoduganella lurida]TWI69289.1 conjugal transfer pilus assembly protein TraB [Pseudoduganella lurida]